MNLAMEHNEDTTTKKKQTQNDYSYPRKVHKGIDVTFIFFNFLPVSYDLLNLQWIDIFGPTTFNMVHTTCLCLISVCICLQTSTNQ